MGNNKLDLISADREISYNSDRAEKHSRLFSSLAPSGELSSRTEFDNSDYRFRNCEKVFSAAYASSSMRLA